MNKKFESDLKVTNKPENTSANPWRVALNNLNEKAPNY